MARRIPSEPPILNGFSFVRALGSGGFADVFLYEQDLPRRQVAVKVLLSDTVNPRATQMFVAESRLMAHVSTHPAILTVFDAGVAADGRLYLVMEYCPSGYGDTYRTERIPIPEVLKTGIRMASALETAHRSHVLHRDVKPANILFTVYGHSVLSDFGIAATVSASDRGEAAGLSVPWSAPEIISQDTTGTVSTDIFSLGATLFSLVAGRTPFERAGKDNTPGVIAARILKGKPDSLDRRDVPESLQLLLARTLARDPLARPLSALAFARELQAVEAGLGIAQTQIDVPMYVDPVVSGAGDTQLTNVVPDRRRPWQRRGSRP
jgi:serine/threonine protein kinase